MRVDSGIYKGRKLLENKYDHIRPTTDKVKQALFVKLQFFIPNKKVLDFFPHEKLYFSSHLSPKSNLFQVFFLSLP